MKLLSTIYDSDVRSGTENKENNGYKLRLAARAVVFDEQGRIALLNVTKQNHHKLPGGGVEEGENMPQALERELLEEIGCEAEILDEVGEVIEYRDEWKMKQISDCFLAKKVGEQKSTNYDEGEIADGFEVFWADNIYHAINLLELDKPANYDGEFIQKRDLLLLNTAKPILLSSHLQI